MRIRTLGAAALLGFAACAPALAPPVAPLSPNVPPRIDTLPATSFTMPRAVGDFDLSVRNIMRGPELVGRSPDDLRWSEDGQWLWFRWRRPEQPDTATHLFRVAAGGGEPELVPDSLAERMAPAQNGEWNPARTRRAFERRGDIYVVDVGGGERRITDTPARERSPHLPPDG